MKTLFCYRTKDEHMELVPARGQRQWMDATPDRFAYRCLPLSMANSTGWELLCPLTFTAEWNGGEGQRAIRFSAPDDHIDRLSGMVLSHFGSGVITFHTGWLFQTPPGWALQVRGAPNWVKDGIQALDGLVETDWLPFPFTMNWKFTRPGKVTFKQGEPLCHILPVPHAQFNQMQPVIANMSDNPDLQRQYKEWGESRETFLKKLAERDPDAMDEGWQRFYMHGKKPDGEKSDTLHLSKRRMKTPRDATPDDILE